MNKDWHDRNGMPKAASQAERIAWHAEHAIHCGCRAVPESLRAEVKKRLAARRGKKKTTAE
jgi:hypothetical protein